jgi:acyl carrier protein
MYRNDLEREIADFIVDNFLFGHALDFDPVDSLLDNGVIDSTGVLELIAFLESQYVINMLDEDVVPENLDSIQNIAAFVTRKLSCAA